MHSTRRSHIAAAVHSITKYFIGNCLFFLDIFSSLNFPSTWWLSACLNGLHQITSQKINMKKRGKKFMENMKFLWQPRRCYAMKKEKKQIVLAELKMNCRRSCCCLFDKRKWEKNLIPLAVVDKSRILASDLVNIIWIFNWIFSIDFS